MTSLKSKNNEKENRAGWISYLIKGTNGRWIFPVRIYGRDRSHAEDVYDFRYSGIGFSAEREQPRRRRSVILES